MVIIYNYSKLLGRMVEKGYTRESMSKAIGLSSVSFGNKLHGRVYFKQDEIDRMSKLLDIDDAEIGLYFFAQ